LLQSKAFIRNEPAFKSKGDAVMKKAIKKVVAIALATVMVFSLFTFTALAAVKTIVEYKWSVSSIQLDLGAAKKASFKLIAVYSDGSTKDATATSDFSVDDPKIAKLTTKGQIEAVAAGETYIWLENPSVASIKVPGVLKVTVEADSIVEYKWSVSSVSLGLPDAADGYFKLLAVYASGKEVDATATSEMSVDDPKIAKMDVNGHLVAVSAGETYVWLENPSAASIKVPGVLKVVVANDGKLVSIAWNVKDLSLKVDETKYVCVLGTYKSGAVRDITHLVKASIDSGSAASVSSKLAVKGVYAGKALMTISEIPYEVRLPKPLTVTVKK
jgi:uncharacterized cupredoxin-like copper-binding protein